MINIITNIKQFAFIFPKLVFDTINSTNGAINIGQLWPENRTDFINSKVRFENSTKPMVGYYSNGWEEEYNGIFNNAMKDKFNQTLNSILPGFRFTNERLKDYSNISYELISNDFIIRIEYQNLNFEDFWNIHSSQNIECNATFYDRNKSREFQKEFEKQEAELLARYGVLGFAIYCNQTKQSRTITYREADAQKLINNSEYINEVIQLLKSRYTIVDERNTKYCVGQYNFKK